MSRIQAINAMCDERWMAPLAKLSMLVDRFPPISGRRLKRGCRKVRATEGTPSANLLDNAAIAELLSARQRQQPDIVSRRLSVLPGQHLRGRRSQRILRQREDPSPNSKELGHGLLAACTAGLSCRRRLLSRHRFVASFSRSLKHAEF